MERATEAPVASACRARLRPQEPCPFGSRDIRRATAMRSISDTGS